MKSADIKTGETYTFMGSESPARSHIEPGTPFTVVEIKAVWRKIKRAGSRKVKRFFNEDGVGARADELEPRDEPERTIAHEPLDPIDDLPF